MNKLPLFTSARLKLTLTYIIIFMMISGVISSLFFYRTSQIIEAEYERLDRRIQMEITGQAFPGPRMMERRIQPEDLAAARQQIIVQLLYINGLIVVVVAVLGYILSGITLAPIQRFLEEQKRFVADAAHELRTPITALKTSLEVNLMDKQLDKPTKHLLSENLEDVISLETITNNLLKLSKLNHQPIEKTSVDISQVITRSIKQMQPLANQKHIKLLYQPKKGAQAIVIGEMSSLIELINIFLDNAIKYSPKHTKTTITSSCKYQRCHIVIRDQGVGISKQHLGHIFDRFYRIDPSRSKELSQGGYGLGLSIAKRIVEEHHGDIQVQSIPTTGTTFTISLPLN